MASNKTNGIAALRQRWTHIIQGGGEGVEKVGGGEGVFQWLAGVRQSVEATEKVCLKANKHSSLSELLNNFSSLPCGACVSFVIPEAVVEYSEQEMESNYGECVWFNTWRTIKKLEK